MKRNFTIAMLLTLVLCILMSVCAEAYKLPQDHSTDTIGDVPEVVIPDAPAEQDGILVFLNQTEIPLEYKPYEKAAVIFFVAEDIFPKLGMNVQVNEKAVSVSNEKVSALFKVGENKGTVNNKEITLTAVPEVKEYDGKSVICVPACVIAEVLNAKVWYDIYSQTIVISTGNYKNDEILRIINYKFWMNGEPYYELSFNKYDLVFQISSSFSVDATWPTEEYQIQAAEAALKQLHDLGFKTIRVFCTSGIRGAYARSQLQRDKFYTMMDKVFDLCDKYEIKMVVCMALLSGDFSPRTEDMYDGICNKDSESRKNIYDYIDTFITRYKDRKSVLMWEIVNEGSLDCDVGWSVNGTRFSLYQLGEYYADVTARIKANDPDHLVTGGDSCFRAAQWHLYLGVKAGRAGNDWTRDTLEDRLKAYQMLYHGLDVISIHTYSLGLGDSEFKKSSTDSTKVKEDFNLYMEEAKRMGKVLYNGETAVNADSYSEEVYQLSLQYIQDMIDAGVQLSHWWTFRSDRQGNFNDGYGWRIDEGELLEAIIDGNKRLKEKYCVNMAVNDNTNAAWTDSAETVVVSAVTEPTAVGVLELPVEKESKGCGSVISSSFAVVTMALAAFVALKKKH